MGRALLGALVLTAALGAGSAPAQAAPPALVVWTGGLSPEDGLTGVLLRSDGTGDLLSASPADRAKGNVQTVGSFTLTGGQLAGVNAAAQAAAAGPSFTGAPRPEDGGYATAVIESGGQRRTVLGRNGASPQLRALIAALDAALPATHQLIAPPDADVHATKASGAHAAVVPFVPDNCPNDQSAVDIDKDISLKDAAAAGVVKLTSKGGFEGDKMAVDADWKNFKAPVTVKVRMEINNPSGDTTDYASKIEKIVESRLNGSSITSGPEKGEPIKFDLDVHQRAPGTQPTPCFNQVQMIASKGFRSYVDGYGPGGDEIGGNKAPHGAEWAIDDPSAYAHETLHFVGFDDRYTDTFVTKKGKVIPLPENGLEGDALAAALKPLGLTPKSGYLASKPTPAGKNHIMGDGGRNPKIKLPQADLKKLAANAVLHIHADPGNILPSKNPSEQDLGTGAPFDLDVHKGHHAHVDGMVTYCIDRFRHSPTKGNVFDVLGPAAALGPDGAALARVLTAAAGFAPGPLKDTPGAQSAVWRVSDNLDPNSDADSAKILAAAGINPDQEFNVPRVRDPNAARLHTSAAVSRSRVLPRVRTLPPLRLPAPRLAGATLLGTPPAAGTARQVLALQVTLGQAGGVAHLSLQRRAGRGWRTLRRYGRRLASGGDVLSLAAPKLARGRYRVLVAVGHTSRAAAFRVG